MSDASPVIQLGFCVPIESEAQRELVGHRTSAWEDWDGGQAGGEPTWLDPNNVPSTPPSCCGAASMRFVCQIYAPRDNDVFNFHRTLYVWGCDRCNSVVVWRCQLPKENPYWATECAAEQQRARCAVCNFPSTGVCPKQKLPFCGKDHQRHFLKRKTVGIQYKVYEIVVEEEPEKRPPSHSEGISEHSVIVQEDPDSDAELEQEDLNEALTGQRKEKLMSPEDELAWDSFHEMIRDSRDQVLRYGGLQPLWIRSAPSNLVVPNCEECGAPRTFEFQLMPQLLQFLAEDDDPMTKEASNDAQVSVIAAVDDLIQQAPAEVIPPELVERKEAYIRNIETQGLDWGVVAIYTCSKSCEVSAYTSEYAYVQSAFASAK